VLSAPMRMLFVADHWKTSWHVSQQRVPVGGSGVIMSHRKVRASVGREKSCLATRFFANGSIASNRISF